MLHTVNKSPFSSTSMKTCLQFMTDNDCLLLFEDGVYGAQAGTKYEGQIKEVLGKHKIYALQADLKARAIDKLVPGVEIVDYNGFVDLAAEHKINNWL